MSGKMPESVKGGSNPKFTPLMMNSFSRLSSSGNRRNSSVLNGTADSGYLSSFTSNTSFTPSTEASTSSSQPQELYCSTPVTGGNHVLSHMTGILNQSSETPVQCFSSLKNIRGRYSEDRIPRRRTLLPSIDQEAEIDEHDILSRLISQSTPAVRRILQFLGEEDLLRLCQVSSVICRAVCDDQLALKRLSKYLIVSYQTIENRVTSRLPHPLGVARATIGGALRAVDNFLDTSLPSGTVWTVPSPLECIDIDQVPVQLRSLIAMTKGLSQHQYVASCHSCRCLVPVRRRSQIVECSSCQHKAKKNETLSFSRVPNSRSKKTLFPGFR